MPEFGCQHYLIPSVGQYFAENLFRPTAASVAVSSVEERHSGIDGRANHSSRSGGVKPPTEIVAAETDD
jgi:hypothetical protein